MMSAEALAEAMFFRRCELEHAEQGLPEAVWAVDPGVRAFWMAEAEFVLGQISGRQG